MLPLKNPTPAGLRYGVGGTYSNYNRTRLLLPLVCPDLPAGLWCYGSPKRGDGSPNQYNIRFGIRYPVFHLQNYHKCT